MSEQTDKKGMEFSDDIVRKAIELSDDEMDKVAGGNGILLLNDIDGFYVYICNAGVSVDEFYNHRCVEKTFTTCSCNTNSSAYATCEGCGHFRRNTNLTAGEKDALVNPLLKSGYGIRDVDWPDIAY